MPASLAAPLAAMVIGFFALLIMGVGTAVAVRTDELAMHFNDDAHQPLSSVPTSSTKTWLPHDGGYLDPVHPRLHERELAGQRPAPTLYPTRLDVALPRWNSVSAELRALIDSELGAAAPA